MNQQELKNILELHRKWVLGESDGVRADLSRADLSRANLGEADLSGANLSRADLSDANLSYANLSRANLSRANLSDANLSDANLRYADLRYADLSDANLSYADLSGADLGEIKKEYIEVLAAAKSEVVGLYKAILEGNIDGTKYEGECACLKGTIANIKHEPYMNLSGVLKADSASISEKWFLAIKEGDTPRNNPVSKITAEWTEEFLKENGFEIPTMKVVWSDEND